MHFAGLPGVLEEVDCALRLEVDRVVAWNGNIEKLIRLERAILDPWLWKPKNAWLNLRATDAVEAGGIDLPDIAGEHIRPLRFASFRNTLVHSYYWTVLLVLCSALYEVSSDVLARISPSVNADVFAS